MHLSCYKERVRAAADYNILTRHGAGPYKRTEERYAAIPNAECMPTGAKQTRRPAFTQAFSSNR